MGGGRKEITKVLSKYMQVPLICYVGGISKERGMEPLIQAMEYVDARLMLAGEVSDEYKDRLIRLKGAAKCTFLGYLTQEEVGRLYEKCSIGCCTLLGLSNAYHSWPIKLFEYMAAGLPVVASDFPGFRKLVLKHQCGLCVNPKDSRQIAEALNKLLMDEKRMEQMGRNGRMLIEKKCRWDREEKKLTAFYQRMSM